MKISDLWSFKVKLFAGVVLLILVIALVYLIKFRSPGINTISSKDTLSNRTEQTSDDKRFRQPDLRILQSALDKQVDSILYTFGIKKDWITTVMPGMKVQTFKSNTPHRDPKEAQWFVKDVLIPKDLTSAEINLDLTIFIRQYGFEPDVQEDIRSKDIVFDVNMSADSISKKPLARVYITHSDKVMRESGMFCLILTNLSDYKKDDVDNILRSTNDFTFVFPRSLENVELQSKLAQGKRDFIITMTMSGKDNSDADFYTLDDKDIRQKVKSFSVDYPNVTRVLLRNADANAPPPGLADKIKDEFSKFSVKVITDSMLAPLLSKADEDSKDKVKLIVAAIKQRAAQFGKGISVISLSYDEFNKLNNELLVLKKLGYRFYNLNDYLFKESEKLKKEKEKEDKKKQETEKNTKDTKKDNDIKDKTKPEVKKPPVKKNDKKK